MFVFRIDVSAGLFDAKLLDLPQVLAFKEPLSETLQSE
jgi:hypothetical protein